jgi:hypothetical protein
VKHSELGQWLNPLLHRDCPKCEARMRLTLIEPEPSGQEKLVFECNWCRQGEAVLLGLKKASRVAPNSGVDRNDLRSDIIRAGLPKQATGAALVEWMREHYRRLGQAPRF